mmetsp:Transcript_27050/g.79933  ORF Transcript_27050/g.79933 Transcript_27050/m.79933 type:complete len:230 (-) Transcript_27050:222-911(-)
MVSPPLLYGLAEEGRGCGGGCSDLPPDIESWFIDEVGMHGLAACGWLCSLLSLPMHSSPLFPLVEVVVLHPASMPLETLKSKPGAMFGRPDAYGLGAALRRLDGIGGFGAPLDKATAESWPPPPLLLPAFLAYGLDIAPAPNPLLGAVLGLFVPALPPSLPATPPTPPPAARAVFGGSLPRPPLAFAPITSPRPSPPCLVPVTKSRICSRVAFLSSPHMTHRGDGTRWK